jgi:hypothetical protein
MIAGTVVISPAQRRKKETRVMSRRVLGAPKRLVRNFGWKVVVA